MKDLLLIEKSKFSVKSTSDSDKYTLEGVFTEFDSENRNGRVYTKKEFQPHFDALKRVVEDGTCVGELDHPKQFETTLRNVSHKIEDIWMDEQNNRVMGRIKLLDTDAGKQAKALIDAGIPLHISSRAAGTVTENKSVKIHKLFTYDLVDTPGFENARLKSSVNESFGFLNESTELDRFSDFAIYEVQKQIKQDMNELNNKNKEIEKMDYIKESEFNAYTDFTKEAIESVKTEIKELQEVQESIIEQNDSIVDEYSNADFKGRLDTVDEKLTSIENKIKTLEESKDSGKELTSSDETVEYHVGDKFEGKVIRAVEKTDDGKTTLYFESDDDAMILENKIEESSLAKPDTLQVGQQYKDKGTITSIEVQDDGGTKVYIDSMDEPIILPSPSKVDNIIDDKTLQEKLDNMETKYADLEAKFEAMIKWSNHTTDTVSALEKWSDHATDTISVVENWSDHVTETVTGIENWSDHVTETVSMLESVDNKKENDTTKINENKINDFKASIYNKLESILEDKEQKSDNNESLNESKQKSAEKSEAPLWMQMIPAKYKETWESLDEVEQIRITNRANLFEFKTQSAIKEFWNNELTKENLIKEEKSQPELSVEEKQAHLNEKRMKAVNGYKNLFG